MNEWARTWGLRLLALGIAIGIWFNASVQDRLVSSEKVVEAAIAYSRPNGFVLINPAQNVNVRVSGTKKAIRQLSPYMVNVSVDLGQRQTGVATINLTGDNVLLPDGLEVVSIEPNTIRVDLEREVIQNLPVLPKLTGRPAAGATVGKPESLPNQIKVIGPEPMLSRIDSLSTRPVSLDGHASTFEEKDVAIVLPDPLIQIVPPPLAVTVTVPIQPPPERPEPQKPRKDKGKKT
ncbi:MAG: YbbR-like domain-containing protein [Thermoanaerobaculia bacterium]